MPKSYDPGLGTDVDWVRFLVGDRDPDTATLDDLEIKALLAEEPNKYYAAARAAELVIARTGGLIEKQVDDLRLRFSDGGPETAYRSYIATLRKRGAEAMTPVKDLSFRVL